MGWASHEFSYESFTDLFRCARCGQRASILQTDADIDQALAPCSVVVVLPDTEGEMEALLFGLDEVLAGVVAWAREEGAALPAAVPAERAERAVAHLAALSRSWEQAVRYLEASAKVLAAPDG